MENLIHIYTICYNEEIILPFFFKHYKKMFGENVKITVYDNYSTDNSVKICEENGAEVILYDTGGKLSDSKYLEIKNNCWKNQDEIFCLICDVDEILHITLEQLLKEYREGNTIIRSEGWNIINDIPDPCEIVLENMKYGDRAYQYDKSYLFNSKFIQEINYGAGCHNSHPVGTIKYGDEAYKLFHYKALSEQYLVDRYKIFAERLSDDNKARGWGAHYLDSEETIRRNHKHFQQIDRLTKVIE